VDRIPANGGLSFLDRLDWSIGGNAANAAVAFARLGGVAQCVGRVGSDPAGDFLVEALDSAGVGTHWLERGDFGETATTVVLVDGLGERSFLHRPGGNAVLALDVLDRLPVASGDWVLIAGYPLLRRFRGAELADALRRLRERGVRLCMDTVGHPDEADGVDVIPALAHVDWFVPSEGEALGLVGVDDIDAASARFLGAGARNVVVKRGAAGCRWSTGAAGPEDFVPPRVDVMDTLGAGDAWCAGLISALGAGWGARDAMRAANRVGADSVSGRGASEGIRPFDTLAARFVEPPS
jgi:sugar/nucleoside kinase (ribokinase family)